MDLRTPRVAVVGAGISGLAAAHRLAELAREGGRRLELAVFESAPRPGGMIRTERDGDLLLEAGPDQFVTYKPAALELCRRLGLEDELLFVPARRPSTQILFGGRLHDLPAGMAGLLPSGLGALLQTGVLSWRGRLRAACEPLVRTRLSGEDESLAAFVRRRWGAEVLERLAEPMLAGIFVADADSMSVEATVPRLRALERRHGSVTRGLRGAPQRRDGVPAFAALRGGLGRLPERLARRLPAGSLRARCGVRRVVRLGPAWRVESAGGGWSADAVVLACPAWAAAALVREHDEGLARLLARTAHACCATVNLDYPAGAVGRPPAGFGFFVPRGEGLPLLACSHVSLKFPGRTAPGRVLLRAFVGGARDPGTLALDDERLAALVHRTLAPLLELRSPPGRARVHRFERAMPQLPVGFPQQARELRQRLDGETGLEACGGALGTIGLPDCIASAEQAAARALAAAEAAAEARRTGPRLAASGA